MAVPIILAWCQTSLLTGPRSSFRERPPFQLTSSWFSTSLERGAVRAGVVAGEDGWREVCSLGASPESIARPAQKISEGSAPRGFEPGRVKAREGPMTVFVYVNTSKQIGDAEHIKVFANVDAV